jgi:hypothetical protein
LLQFLAFRLGEVKRDCQQLQDQLANSKVGCVQPHSMHMDNKQL